MADVLRIGGVKQPLGKPGPTPRQEPGEKPEPQKKKPSKKKDQ